MASSKNCTTLRLLHYPCLPEDKIIKPGQIRCGEHTDYGSITLRDLPGGIMTTTSYTLKSPLTKANQLFAKMILPCCSISLAKTPSAYRL